MMAFTLRGRFVHLRACLLKCGQPGRDREVIIGPVFARHGDSIGGTKGRPTNPFSSSGESLNSLSCVELPLGRNPLELVAAAVEQLDLGT